MSTQIDPNQKELWILRSYLLVTFLSFLAGCASATPSKYFALELQVEKHKTTHSVRAFWSCDARDFPVGGFGLDRETLTAITENGWVIAVPMPRDTTDDKSHFIAGFQCEDPDKHLALFTKRLAIFEGTKELACYDDYYPAQSNGDGDKSVRLLSSRIVRPAKSEFVAAQSWSNSPASKAVTDVMSDTDFRGFRALVVPETAWQSDRALMAVLSNKTSFFTSGSPRDYKKWSDDQKEYYRAFFQFLLGSPYINTREILGEGKNRRFAERGILLRGFVLRDGQWEMQEESTPFVHKCRGTAPIRYRGEILRIHDAELFFDPQTRQIIFVTEYTHE